MRDTCCRFSQEDFCTRKRPKQDRRTYSCVLARDAGCARGRSCQRRARPRVSHISTYASGRATRRGELSPVTQCDSLCCSFWSSLSRAGPHARDLSFTPSRSLSLSVSLLSTTSFALHIHTCVYSTHERESCMHTYIWSNT